jgi:hypothetical protein
LNSKNHLEYTDEMLSFLYSSAVFQSLSENQQRTFLNECMHDQHFYEILNIAQTLQEVIEDVERIIPPATKEMKQFYKTSKKKILDKVEIDKNVVFVPTEHFKKKCGPLIVCLQQGDEMIDVEQFCKGLLLTLCDLCYGQRRDLYVVLFAEHTKVLSFELDRISLDSLMNLIQNHQDGPAKLLPALEKSLTIYNNATINDYTEVMIITNNHFVDYNEDTLNEFAKQFKKKEITVSAVAMSEESFGRQPLHFVDKVFFINE